MKKVISTGGFVTRYGNPPKETGVWAECPKCRNAKRTFKVITNEL